MLTPHLSSICIITLIRIWVTTLIHGENAQKMYSLIALLTGLEATLGVINCCLPVMKPVFSKFHDSTLWKSWAASFPTVSTSPGGGGRSTTASTAKPIRAQKQYKVKNGAMVGVFGSNKEMQSLPVSATPSSPEANMHKFVGSKAAQIMFSHTTSAASSKPGSPMVDAPPRPPPKSKYYEPERTRVKATCPPTADPPAWEEKAETGTIVVRLGCGC